MNFFTIILLEIILVSALLVYFFVRDIKKNNTFLNKNKKIGYSLIAFLILIILCGIDTFIEPRILVKNEFDFTIKNLSQPIKIVFIADIQSNQYKNENWTNKIVKKIQKIKPDLILLGGDLISNEGAFEDESQYLKPLDALVDQYPIYYILGNHEYGIGSVAQKNKNLQTGDRSAKLITTMAEMKIPLLRNTLTCPEINKQKICVFGIDDIYTKNASFEDLKKWDKQTPLIFLTHNPDGIMLYPINQPNPDLTLAGHTHGGQIRLPFIGPLGNPGVELDKKYFKGLNDWMGMKIFTTAGVGESGAPIRFWNLPEIAVINLKPQI